MNINMNTNDFPQGPFLPLKLEIVIKYLQFFEYSFFILKPNQEFVEITVDKKTLKATMGNYQRRGLKEIYLKEEDYNDFSSNLRQHLEQKASFKDALLDIESLYSGLRQQFLSFGMSGITIRAAEEMNKMVIAQVTKSAGVAQLIVEFKDKFPEAFLTYIMLSYVSTSMIDMFSWRSQQIKLKIGMASMLCNIELTQKDLETINTSPQDQLPDSLRMYPIHTAANLQKNDPMIPAEVIQMIEMHRELPDANGFPLHLRHTSIPLLPSIFIVAYNFIQELKKNDLDGTKISEILNYIYASYNKGIFHQATLSLFSTFGSPIPA